MPKILVWDLETSTNHFKANSGWIFCAGFKELGKPGEILYRDNMQPDPLNDKKLVKQIYDRLVQSDVWVTHNGRWFDIRFLNARLAKWGLPFLPRIPHFDTCELIFKNLAMRASLEEASKFLGCKATKHKLDMDVWMRAGAGSKADLAEIVKHCKADLTLTEFVYKRLRPIGVKHPNMALISGNNLACPVCGKRNTLRKDKEQFAQVKKAVRYQCSQCGGWCHGPYKKVEGLDVRP